MRRETLNESANHSINHRMKGQEYNYFAPDRVTGVGVSVNLIF